MDILSNVVDRLNRHEIRGTPYVIAEVGVNHENNMETAKRLIEEAKNGGADAVKFQTYRAHTLASKNSPAYWDTSQEETENQYQLFRKHDKFWKNEFDLIKKHCEMADIEFLSTPFDTDSADFLNDLMNVFKISSSDITNQPLVKHICRFGKPIILSTGASNLDEIDRALQWIDEAKLPVALLHCVLNYPTPDKHANLRMILGLKRRYPDRVVGYSDHTLPSDMRVLELAWVLGAEILEKHFTHDKNLPGNDHYHAMDINDLKMFRKNLERVEELLGMENKCALPSEELSRKHARRSLVSARFISVGTKINEEMLICKRPGSGISPVDMEKVVGREAAVDIQEDDLLMWEMLR